MKYFLMEKKPAEQVFYFVKREKNSDEKRFFSDKKDLIMH